MISLVVFRGEKLRGEKCLWLLEGDFLGIGEKRLLKFKKNYPDWLELQPFLHFNMEWENALTISYRVYPAFNAS